LLEGKVPVPDAPIPASPPNCDKCNQPTRLVTVISRLGDTPAHRIFQCDACHVLKWVAEKIVATDGTHDL
jgi:hypothetical protein